MGSNVRSFVRHLKVEFGVDLVPKCERWGYKAMSETLCALTRSFSRTSPRIFLYKLVSLVLSDKFIAAHLP
jgi:hypothetical protein